MDLSNIIKDEHKNINITKYSSLDDFIKQNVTSAGSKMETHQIVYDTGPRLNFLVKKEDYEIFMKLYRIYLNSDIPKKYGIMEKSLDIGPLYFDFDIKMSNEERLFEKTEIIDIVVIINKILKKYYTKNNESMYKSYILYKKKPSYDSEKGKYNDGFHIHYPEIITDNTNKNIIYNLIFDKLKDNLLMLKIINKCKMDLDSIFDKIIKNTTSWWYLYKSGKLLNKNNNYEVQMILNEKYEEEKMEKDKFITNNLSIQKPNQILTITLKEKHIDLVNNINKKNVDKTSFFIENKKNNCVVNIKQSSEELKNIDCAIKLCNMLDSKRAEKYDTWRDVGYALYNISPELKKSFHEFSALSEKYKASEIEKFWDNCNFKENSNYMEGLEQWARKDNPTEYSNYLTLKIDKVFRNEKIDLKTDYDLAYTINDLYQYDYVCSSIEKQPVWWEFKKHRWHRCEKAATLNMKLSGEFAYQLSGLSKIYNDLFIKNQNDTNSEYYLKKSKDAIDLIKKLKSKIFKERIIAEASVIFFVKNNNFIEKLDSNQYLLGFENGVYDLNKMVFREGEHNDYITYSTGYKYVEINKNDPRLKIINDFFDSIFPTAEEKKYLLIYLASILEGKNKDQFALIWTGSGANGKGTLTKLMAALLGDYYSTCDPTIITLARSKPGEASPHLADKVGKRWLEVSEPEQDSKIETGVLKQLTGEDKIQARPLYGAIFYYIPQFKFTLQCNNKPELKSDDGGVRRRVRVLNFPMKFVNEPTKKNERKKDNKLEEKLLECKDVLMWILINEYYVEYTKKGNLEYFEPQSVKDNSAEYLNNSNIFKVFIDSKYTYTDNVKDKMDIGNLWFEYTEWHKVNYPSVKQQKQPKLIEFLKLQDLIISKNGSTVYKLLKKEFTNDEE